MSKRCAGCDREVKSSKIDVTMPYEDGGNSFAYWRCPYCGYENILEGYGDDDD